MRKGHAIESLLNRLCADLGFCLPAEERATIVTDPPRGVEAFAQRVWRAEGMGDIPPKSPLYQQLVDAIASFPEVGSMRVLWSDGTLIASVTVDPNCRPRESLHVVGSVDAGPGFAALAPAIERMKALHASAQDEAALAVSAEMDEFGITAEDDIGRVYNVFNIVFAPGGLQFAVAPAEGG